jgi:ribosomal protein S27AE
VWPNFRPSNGGVLVRFIEFVRRHNGHRCRLPPARGRLVDCGRCGSDFVNPVARHEQGETTVQLGWGVSMTRWWIRLRCGQCGDVREVEVSDAEAKRFKRELERGVADVAAGVARIEHDGAEALMAALRDP